MTANHFQTNITERTNWTLEFMISAYVKNICADPYFLPPRASSVTTCADQLPFKITLATGHTEFLFLL